MIDKQRFICYNEENNGFFDEWGCVLWQKVS